MPNIILFNKPFNVLSQFTDNDGRPTLADYITAPGYRVAGRLDFDSEGLLVLTDNGRLQQEIASPAHKRWKNYLVQVEGDPDDKAVEHLVKGVLLKDGLTLPAKAKTIAPPVLWERVPPIRKRKTVTDSWLEISIREGRNRQIRRMTANVGFPTLRLVRFAVGEWTIEGLAPGQLRAISMRTPVPRETSSRPSKKF
ncbi:MAG: pseudouridine synthase [Halioglobus sp.]|nr:pseudouridine synthase [Halioglobus sp.]